MKALLRILIVVCFAAMISALVNGKLSELRWLAVMALLMSIRLKQEEV